MTGTGAQVQNGAKSTFYVLENENQNALTSVNASNPPGISPSSGPQPPPGRNPPFYCLPAALHGPSGFVSHSGRTLETGPGYGDLQKEMRTILQLDEPENETLQIDDQEAQRPHKFLLSTMADSVAIFAEGTFEEQIQELVNYIVRNRSEEERTAFIRPFQDALKTEPGKKPLDEDDGRRRKIFSMVVVEVKTLGDGSEKGRLSNLFNALPRKSPLRFTVYTSLLDLATANEDLAALQLSRVDVNKWLREWDISSEEKSKFLKTIVDAYEKSGDLAIAYEYSLEYVRSLPPGGPATEAAAVETIATALRLPFVFDFDPLFKLDAVVAVKNHELFSLLQIFLNDGLPQFKAWEEANAGSLQKYQLESTHLVRKIRLLTLASLGFKNIGQDLPYAKVAEALQVEPSEVEKWVIDVIRAGLLSGKLSQTSQSLHITRSTARSFEREQWEALEKRLVAWKAGLAGVLEVVAAARKQSAPGSHAAGAQTQVAA
ncbi:Eukaryotic translation initiation factor 3 subunit M [Mycena sanguinolenta]|uniref:Eukaryotic translation initiation factor 3 subunit M n=1 Tax=Mycena sanguinolenta TaxID=230812 RepID=A0A8H6YAS8_9AGAR|nr:Eukaryotic translation initiation factor 3 subunit M [Mycena sanguinolenta]